jgi:hypothetical protein
LPSPIVQAIPLADLKPYISDLQSATWHGWDANILKWLSDKPLAWFVLGALVVVGGLYIVNKVFLLVYWVFFLLNLALMRLMKRIAHAFRFTMQ